MVWPSKCSHESLTNVDHSEAIQDLLEELEASKQSRLRAWNVLQRLRLLLSELGNVAIPPPAQKTFDAEGEILEQALTKSFRIRNENGEGRGGSFERPTIEIRRR